MAAQNKYIIKIMSSNISYYTFTHFQACIYFQNKHIQPHILTHAHTQNRVNFMLMCACVHMCKLHMIKALSAHIYN